MISLFRCHLAPMLASLVLFAAPASAGPVVIHFTASIQSGTDPANLFGEAADPDLAGQILTGSVSIDPAAMTPASESDGISYGDFGAGAVSVSVALNGMSLNAVSSGTIGYFGNRSGGEVTVGDLADGGYNYMDAGASTPDGMVQVSLSALFNRSVALSAASVGSLAAIGDGKGLTVGGVTVMTASGEHVTAALLFMSVPEPASWSILLLASAVLLFVRNRCFPAARLLVADTGYDR